MIYILILFLATSASLQSGAGGISVEFSSQKACEIAGKALAQSAYQRGNNVLVYGCVPKGDTP